MSPPLSKKITLLARFLDVWWGSIFLVNVPLVAIASLAMVFLLPNPATRTHPAPTLPVPFQDQ